jgi:phosphate transport system substrate-binding protein
VKITRRGAAAGAAAALALALAGCGTDNNGSSGPSNPSIDCASGTLTAAGSTAQANAMSDWTKALENQCASANVNYQGGGSGKGVQQFQEGTIDFAGSDFALSDKDKPAADARCRSGRGSGGSTGGPAIDLPMVPGPIAVGYNVPGVDAGLNLSASNLAKIFTGKISDWNDPAIAADNPGVTLPNLGIQTFHRADGSGTSYNFSNYLAHEAKADFGFDADKNWPAPGGQGSNGTQGIAQGVKSTSGGIGYMEESFATQNNITVAKVGNEGGKFVELTEQNVQNFLSKAAVTGNGNDLKLAFDYTDTDADAYPALLVTYEIVCQSGNDSAKLPLLKNFLSYISSTDAQNQVAKDGYVPLPVDLQTKVAAAVGSLD